MDNRGTVVARRKPKQIERLATTVREHLGIPLDARISLAPVLELLDFLFEDAYFEVLEPGEMAGAEGRTSAWEPVISLSAGTYAGLLKADGRARMTVAHELGHLLMHCRRPASLNRTTKYDALCDPEWQAESFAAALLMPRKAFLKTRTVEEAMRTFGVTRGAAMVRARKLHHTFGGNMQKKRTAAVTRRP